MQNSSRFVRPPADARLWYDPALPLKLGCTVCPDLSLCGGLRIPAGVFDCRALCVCVRSGGRCCGLCRHNSQTFVARVREVGGFAFDNVPRTAKLPTWTIARYVPIIYDGTNRHEGLDTEAVALPLLSLFNRVSGAARFTGRAAMLEAFKLAQDTRVLLTGVDEDRAIERWWSFRERPRRIEGLRALGVEMVTSPNYSLSLLC